MALKANQEFEIDRMLDRVERAVAELSVPVVDLIAVQTRDPYRVLVATILSARTRDEMTSRAAARLFARAPDLSTLASLSEEEIAGLIRPVGFFRNKARYLARLPGVIGERFGGRIPETVEELLKLPGVGRKTANLVSAVAFGRPAICVDTHVHRIMNIWGYVTTKSPEETEMALRAKLPQRWWIPVNRILVAFGQAICIPRRPRCDGCPVADACPKIGVVPHRHRPRPSVQGGARKEATWFLVSWNVNGIRSAFAKGFLDRLAELDPDVLALQESRALPEQLPEELRSPPGYHAYWFPARKKGYAGVAVFSKHKPLSVRHGLGDPEHDEEGRVLTLEFADLYLVNVYFPNARPGLARLGYKLRFNRDLERYLDGLRREKSVVACGDFNVAHQEIDLANPEANRGNPGFSDQERQWLDKLLARGWLDTFRLFNREGGHYTWWSFRGNARARNIGWRIDYFLVDAASRHRVLEAGILPEITGSDHCPVSLSLKLQARSAQGR